MISQSTQWIDGSNNLVKCRSQSLHSRLLPPSRKLCFIGVCLFVCLLAGLRKNYWTSCHNSRWKGGKWPRKKPLDFGDNPDYVTSGLSCELDSGLTSTVGVWRKYVCALLSAILVWWLRMRNQHRVQLFICSTRSLWRKMNSDGEQSPKQLHWCV